jgi:hypothetical protein
MGTNDSVKLRPNLIDIGFFEIVVPFSDIDALVSD